MILPRRCSYIDRPPSARDSPQRHGCVCGSYYRHWTPLLMLSPATPAFSCLGLSWIGRPALGRNANRALSTVRGRGRGWLVRPTTGLERLP